jgi:hypothetical protein
VTADKLQRITTARIHPALGVARIGNSEEHFVGPEIPGVAAYPVGGYRDVSNRLKRQAAQFRVFGYDAADRCVGEITSEETALTWTVHLCNTKAAGRRFAGVDHPRESYRNERWVKNGIPREQFVLDGKPQTVSKNDPVSHFICTEFMGHTFAPALELGRLLYQEECGRLLVLGGHGRSGSPVRAGLDETDGNDFANHDGWFDDVSDGPVQCQVRLPSGAKLHVKPAWVVVGPPKYAPELFGVVTLYDTLYQVAIDRSLIPDPFSDPKFRPSFNRHIYPILKRALDLRWVFSNANVGHTEISAEPGHLNDRQHLFRQFRVPSHHPLQPGTGTGRMPFMWSDLYKNPATNGTLTPFQYRVMQSWAGGDFEDDWDGKPPNVEYRITPNGLDRAALEPCIGAAFFPGIEVSWKVRDVFGYVEPFRLDHHSLAPGDITQQMSLPWQTDFVDCAYEDPYVWWPSQRPIDVRMTPHSAFQPWARPFDDPKRTDDMSATEMVHHFDRLGHVLRFGRHFLETGRVENPPENPINRRNFR